MKKLKLLPAAFLLALCLCLLTGCGKGESAEEEENTESETVYTASFLRIPVEEEKNLEFLALSDTGFYAGSYEKLRDGEIPEGVTPEYEGQYDIYGYRLYFGDLNGTLQPLAYESLPAPENTENLQDYSASAYLRKLWPLPDGRLIAVENLGVSWWEGPEDMDENDPAYWDYYRYEESCWLRHLDAQGCELSSARLQKDNEEDYLEVYYAVCDGAGRLLIPMNESICVYEQDGSCSARIELGDWPGEMVALDENRVGVMTWGRNGTELTLLDLEKMSVGEKLPLENYPNQLYPGKGDYAFYYSSGMRLYGYLLSEKKSVEILNWVDCDVIPDRIQCVSVGEDGLILALCAEEDGPNLATLRQVPRDSIPEKQVLTLGSLYPDQVSEAIIRFNRAHRDVRIEVLDYGQYGDGDSEDEVLEGLTKLSTEIMAGNMPDLLDLQGLPFDQLAAKGLLEDLYPWIDRDGELERGDFLPSVLKAAEQGGKLYRATPGFTLTTLIGASSVVGEEPGWTMEELETALASMPEGCTPLDPNMSRDNVLMMLLFTDMSSYVNWSEASCDFTNEDFYRLLRFCAGFPAQPRYDEGGSSVVGRLAAGKQMLLEATVSNLADVCYYDQYFGGSCTYIGYPTRSGSGNVLIFNNGFAMSAACPNKEAAWEFLRVFLTAAYERESYELPLRHDVFREKVEAAGIEYEKDAAGHYLLDENGERIPVVKGGMGMTDEFGNMLSFDLYGLTEEQAQKLLHAIETADKSMDLNTRIYGIVKEEAAAFFAGQKSAEEVAKLIQSKVGLYLSEQS